MLVLGTITAGVALGLVVWTVVAQPWRQPSGPIIVERSQLIGRPAPEFALESLDGDLVRLADYRGRPVIINFWASWCVPCREEFPLFADARQRHAADGLEILGIIHDDGPANARQFAAEMGARWPMLLDGDETAWNAYGGVFLPITFYIDREGIVRAVSYGPPPPAVLDEQLARIL